MDWDDGPSGLLRNDADDDIEKVPAVGFAIGGEGRGGHYERTPLVSLPIVGIEKETLAIERGGNG